MASEQMTEKKMTETLQLERRFAAIEKSMEANGASITDLCREIGQIKGLLNKLEAESKRKK
jgi:hypothetical protein